MSAQVIELSPSQNPTSSVEMVTPEQAQEYLYKNHNNRNIATDTVTSYARDMRAGDWRSVGDPLRFDSNGNLLDGQHRLHAVIAAQVPVPFTVIRGLSARDVSVIDVGRRRSTANALEMAGFTKNTLAMAAAANVGIADDAGKLISNNSRVRQATHAEVLDWAREHFPLMGDAYLYGMRAYAIHRGSSAGFIYGAYRIYKASPTRALEFLEAVSVMQGDGAGDPRSTLNRRLSVLGRQAGVKSKPSRTTHCFTEAFNAWTAGKKLHSIHDPDGGTPLQPVTQGP